MEDSLTKDEKKKLRQEEWKEKLQKEEQKKRMTKMSWWIGGFILLGLSVWFLYAVVNGSNGSTGSATATATVSVPAVGNDDMTSGPINAKVVFIEYADFQCPACLAAYPLIKQLMQSYNGKVLFVYRFFPLENIHQNALISAQAGYAASKQGKFWEMHDVLFDHQNDWATMSNPQATFVSYAKNLGLNTDQFRKNMTDPKTALYIKTQEQKALQIGLNATPMFFINGKQIEGAGVYSDFKKLIDQALMGK
ncbi:MAG TPA: thioredoxin domain-containing protein [Patescibacteria group bacterium]|nr:thioredoxin domain-containing protein [Patescibacteria group bacterium]